MTDPTNADEPSPCASRAGASEGLAGRSESAKHSGQSHSAGRSLVRRLQSFLLTWTLNVAYCGLLMLVLPVAVYRSVRHGRYRRGLSAKLLGRMSGFHRDEPERPVVWFHAVSVGEVLQLPRLIEGFRRRHHEQFTIVVTTSTDTGYDLAVERFSADCHVHWFPLDFSWAVRRALNTVQPALVVLVELELWPNFLRACHRRGIATAIVNARMSEKSFRGYSRIRRLLASLLQPVTAIASQNEVYADRLLKLGAAPAATTVTGSVKFDQICCDRTNAATAVFRDLFQVSDNQTVFIAGSTQSPEEHLALAAWQTLRDEFPHLRLILVPRHRERFDEVADMVAAAGVPCVRRSTLCSGDAVRSDSVLLLDTIGELSACWGLADVAFVGGSFGSRGGQNMLEPAAYGAAVMVGPNTSNFREIVSQLQAVDGILKLQQPEELAPALRELLNDKAARCAMGDRASQVIVQQQGAVQRTLDCLDKALATTAHSGNRPATAALSRTDRAA